MKLAQFYHEGSAYPARTRLPGLTLSSRPAVYKSYPGEPIGLPTPQVPDTMQVHAAYRAWRAGIAAADTSALTREDLGALLACAEGVTQTETYGTRTVDYRSAPSAGALYPVNLYLVVEKAPGLEPGVYYYQPKLQSLLTVRKDHGAAWSLYQASGSPGSWDGADAVVVLSVTFGRTAFKYKERAYRYVCMDAGHVASNLALGAASLGWRTPMIARFDDAAVNRVLDLDPSVEGAILIMPLARAANEGEEPRFASVPVNGASTSFVAMMQDGTSLRRAGARGDFAPRWAPLAPATGDIPLPPPARGDGVFASAARRRSVREFKDASITTPELSALCLAADGAPADSPAADPLLAGSAPLGLYAAVRDVDGLAPGIYRYVPGSHALRLLRAGAVGDDCAQACLHQEFCGTADVVFIKTVRWEDLAVPDGDRGYRYACIRAGVVGEGLYLQGTALGIGACGVGAFTDPDVAGLVGIDMLVEAPLYVTVMGR